MSGSDEGSITQKKHHETRWADKLTSGQLHFLNSEKTREIYEPKHFHESILHVLVCNKISVVEQLALSAFQLHIFF